MRRLFWRARPPERMAAVRAAGGAARTSSHRGKRFRREVQARVLFTSEVFCERMVRMRQSRGSRAGCGWRGVPNRRHRMRWMRARVRWRGIG